jgi:hypothetical protein
MLAARMRVRSHVQTKSVDRFTRRLARAAIGGVGDYAS